MGSWSPSNPLGLLVEEKPSCIHYNIRGGEAKLCLLKLASVFLHLPSVGFKQFSASAHLRCTREEKVAFLVPFGDFELSM